MTINNYFISILLQQRQRDDFEQFFDNLPPRTWPQFGYRIVLLERERFPSCFYCGELINKWITSATVAGEDVLGQWRNEGQQKVRQASFCFRCSFWIFGTSF